MPRRREWDDHDDGVRHERHRVGEGALDGADAARGEPSPLQQPRDQVGRLGDVARKDAQPAPAEAERRGAGCIAGGNPLRDRLRRCSGS